MSLFEEIKLDDNTFKYRSKLSYKEFLCGLNEDETMLQDFINILKCSSFVTFFFETPKVSSSTLNSTFEFILADAPQLNGARANSVAFSKYFSTDLVTSFLNLGRDALMVVPCPNDESENHIFSSLAPFIREGMDDQVKEFWRRTGRDALGHIQTN
eukprot:GFUD01097240.1.p1 GENE.GFUD01097240.1~~GFUD01097240.1.p1  ORF type:complete len:163 (-),score=35.16 GFUD01097240.1:97-564(-)